MKIAIAGTGYVGLSNAILLAQHHEVTAVDVIPEKVDMVNRRESPIADAYIEDYLKHKKLSLTATLDGDSAYREAELIIIAAPTNYDDVTGHFDTRAVESILSQIQRVKSKALVIIKSTTRRLSSKQASLAFICKRLKLNLKKLSEEEKKWLKKIAQKSDLLKNPNPQRGRK